MQIFKASEPRITLSDINELLLASGRVLLFESAAPRGMPIAWKGPYYARAWESLTRLGLDTFDEIRGKIGAFILDEWRCVLPRSRLQLIHKAVVLLVDLNLWPVG